MQEFFKGWRRKVGCITLMIASLVMVLWARSGVVKDTASVRSNFGHLDVVSGRGRITVWGAPPGGWHAIYGNGISWKTSRVSVDPGVAPDLSGPLEGRHIWIAPHWVIALPLSALAASLIFWKPRKPSTARNDSAHA